MPNAKCQMPLLVSIQRYFTLSFCKILRLFFSISNTMLRCALNTTSAFAIDNNNNSNSQFAMTLRSTMRFWLFRIVFTKVQIIHQIQIKMSFFIVIAKCWIWHLAGKSYTLHRLPLHSISDKYTIRMYLHVPCVSGV